MAMANLHFNILADKHLDRWLSLCLDSLLGNRAAPVMAWKEIGDNDGLALCWNADVEDSTPFPVSLSAREVAPIVQAWLDVKANYPDQPVSGSSTFHRAFRIVLGTEPAPVTYLSGIAFVVEPAWAVVTQ